MKAWERLGGCHGGLDAWAQWFRIEACLNLGGISVISRASLVAQMVRVCLQCRLDLGLIPESGRPPEEGNGNLLQYSRLGNTVDREAWWAIVHGGHKKLETTEQLAFSSVI